MKTKGSIDEKAFVLIGALLILLVVTLMGISSMNTASFDLIISGNYRTSEDAFYAADAGIQDGISRLLTSDASIRIDDTGHENETNWNVGTTYSTPGFNNTFTVTHYGNPVIKAPNNKPYYLIRSTGTSGRASQTVKVLVHLNDTSIFENAILGCDGVEINSNGVIDSYHAQKGAYSSQVQSGKNYAGPNGRVLTVTPPAHLGVGDLKVGSSASVYGDVSVTGTITQGLDRIYGNRTQNANPSDLPPCDKLGVRTFVESKDPSPGTTAPDYVLGSGGTDTFYGSQKYSNFTLDGSGTLYMRGSGSVTLYIDGTFKMGSGSQIFMDKGMDLTIYVKDLVEITGASIVNQDDNPATLKIYSSAEGKAHTFDLQPGGSFHGTVYSPLSDVSVSGSAELFGAIIGKMVRIGGLGVHYDEDLRGGGGGENYRIIYWQQVSN